MTPEQQTTFIKAAQTGVALGLVHRFEWYTNAIRMLHHGPYDEVDAKTKEIEDAFVEFEKGTASCPEEEEQLNNLNVDSYNDTVSDWYHTMRRTALQRSIPGL